MNLQVGVCVAQQFPGRLPSAPSPRVETHPVLQQNTGDTNFMQNSCGELVYTQLLLGTRIYVKVTK